MKILFRHTTYHKNIRYIVLYYQTKNSKHDEWWSNIHIVWLLLLLLYIIFIKYRFWCYFFRWWWWWLMIDNSCIIKFEIIINIIDYICVCNILNKLGYIAVWTNICRLGHCRFDDNDDRAMTISKGTQIISYLI